MSQIPAITYAVVQNVQAQRQGAIEKERQLRRTQAMEKDMAAHEDVLEHQVESSEEVQPAQDEPEQQRKRPKRNPPKHIDGHEDDSDGKPHIDLTA